MSFGIKAQFELQNKHLYQSGIFTTTAMAAYLVGGLPDFQGTFNISPQWSNTPHDLVAQQPHISQFKYSLFSSQLSLLITAVAFLPEKQNTIIVNGLALSHALSATYLSSQVVKSFIPRYRPYAVHLDPNEIVLDDRRSFWSGTSALSMSFAGYFWVFSEAYFPDFTGKRFMQFSSVALGMGVMATRVWANEHYISDVLVGGAVGFTIGYFVARTYRAESTDRGLRFNGTGVTYNF
ncbi:MAG: phosphatase PAP2 family protein [Cryomorphaceae bacterium]|nr:phosphatase PAP2 family protein [Cryomorphaceae bacterium]